MFCLRLHSFQDFKVELRYIDSTAMLFIGLTSRGLLGYASQSSMTNEEIWEFRFEIICLLHVIHLHPSFVLAPLHWWWSYGSRNELVKTQASRNLPKIISYTQHPTIRKATSSVPVPSPAHVSTHAHPNGHQSHRLPLPTKTPDGLSLHSRGRLMGLWIQSHLWVRMVDGELDGWKWPRLVRSRCWWLGIVRVWDIEKQDKSCEVVCLCTLLGKEDATGVVCC